MFIQGWRFLRIASPTLAVVLGLSLMACGKKANPVIPVKILPKAVEELRYRVKGQSLLVSWAIPQQNTDGSPLWNLKGFKVLKGEWPTRDFCPTCPDRFQDTLWVDLMGPQLPDIQIDSHQVQLTYTRLQPGKTYSFQVTAVTPLEISSEPSKILRVAWDLPLRPPSTLQARPKEQGLEVSWEASSALVDGSPPEGLMGYSLSRKMGKGPWTNVTAGLIQDRNYFDGDLQEGVHYSYQVKAVRQVFGNLLESEASEEIGVVFTRLAPPPAVQELIAISHPKGIQLRWEGIVTMTPSGYFVYKRMENQKTAQKITPESIDDIIFEDSQVVPGMVYYYSISAVGGPPALREGPRSREIKVTHTP